MTQLQKKPFDPSGGDVIGFALAERAAGRASAIATLVAIDGASPRALGAQMAVAADGRFTGSISSGCLERAIIDEARQAMTRGAGDVVRYGKGSKFLDVQLPCGSGVDILYTVNPDVEMLTKGERTLRARQAFAIDFGPRGLRVAEATPTGWIDGYFRRAYSPALKICAAGVGAELIVLSRLVSASGYQMCAVSPEADTLAHCVAEEKVQLTGAMPALSIDPWTAFVLLFHDREWEVALAPDVLESQAFFIGAVGSRRTHAARIETLRQKGVDEAKLARIEGPIGLIPATRDPSALAISVLAGVVAAQPQ